MFGFRKAAPPPTETDKTTTLTADRRTTSEPIPSVPKSTGNYFYEDDDDWGRKPPSTASKDKNRYKNGFSNSGGLENQSVQELENYAVYKAEETTNSVNNCLRIAEDIREDATRTLDMLNQQGEQITRTHNMVVDTEKDLSRGEKLLNNLGGMFSKPWKPKKTKEIQGPIITPDKPSKKDVHNKEDREKLGLAPLPKGRSAPTTPPNEPTNAYQKVDVEKAKQDDALSDLSDILGDLKGMAIGMGSELDRQNKALEHLSDDVDELNSRVKGANQRARKLVG
ncbi:putative SNAP25 homologous protein SNAP30 [Cajanus cajan]|uniref:SNAP25 isogenyous protein SNAP30 n=1 Tax=Cajanus cajan TaxID=3821 RepID=A0A151TFG0_CAJCA|nr:putative SNAP25 homologous protein SNAP30 [Cajanus cajan]XP_029127770.1 putative SNAP25 homologous protein SNAP30 [Cajanus cajan]XP_029127771.1 putative SNAP25 homologous protein SNAP30 [Cajanus cajan]KYP65768.1 Putative SNAP25 isogenyous protein SNAP30 [Cajanus cajan]